MSGSPEDSKIWHTLRPSTILCNRLQPSSGDTSYTAARGNALGRQDVAELVIQDDDSGFVLSLLQAARTDAAAVWRTLCLHRHTERGNSKETKLVEELAKKAKRSHTVC